MLSKGHRQMSGHHGSQRWLCPCLYPWHITAGIWESFNEGSMNFQEKREANVGIGDQGLGCWGGHLGTKTMSKTHPTLWCRYIDKQENHSNVKVVMCLGSLLGQCMVIRGNTKWHHSSVFNPPLRTSLRFF